MHIYFLPLWGKTMVKDRRVMQERFRAHLPSSGAKPLWLVQYPMPGLRLKYIRKAPLKDLVEIKLMCWRAVKSSQVVSSCVRCSLGGEWMSGSLQQRVGDEWLVAEGWAQQTDEEEWDCYLASGHPVWWHCLSSHCSPLHQFHPVFKKGSLFVIALRCYTTPIPKFLDHIWGQVDPWCA